jgi:hypothetical protein
MIGGVVGREIRGRVSLRYRTKREAMYNILVTRIAYSVARR